MTVEGVLEANRQRPIDGVGVEAHLLELRDTPEALLELVEKLFERCDQQNAGWLLPPICGWMPLDVLDRAAGQAEAHAETHNGCDAARYLLALHSLRHAGQSNPAVSHIAYPTEIVRSWTERYPLRTGHPTWVSSDNGDAAVVGGIPSTACPRCAGTGERLLSIAAPEESPGDLAHIEFVWCPCCSTYTEVATAHLDERGRGHLDSPELIVEVDPFEVEAFPETAVALVDLGPDWRVQDWMWSNGVENLHRVGGRPTWIQHEVIPNCPDCGAVMSFVAQIAVEDLWAGEGITYLHWCAPCRVTGVVYQQT